MISTRKTISLQMYLVIVSALLFFSSSLLHSATSKYRLSLRSNGATSMVIGWSDDDANVGYGTTDHGTNYDAYPNKVTSSQTVDKSEKGMSHHFARLTGLTPNTVYYFVIRSGSHNSPRMSFKTLPSGSGYTMITGGDSRSNAGVRRDGNRLVAKLRPQAVIFCGDFTNSNSDSEWREWLDDWQLTRSSDGRMQPIIPVLGNHEGYTGSNIIDIFDAKSNYFTVELGDTLVASLVSDGNMNTQKNWLQSELINHQDKRWRVASYHKPMRVHSTAKGDGNDVYNAFAQLFYDYRVQLSVDGDTHLSKTTWPIRPDPGGEAGFVRDDENGTVYAGEGSWGAPLRPYNKAKSWTRKGGSFAQFKWINVLSDKMVLRTVKFENVNNVGTVSDNNPYALPSGIRLHGGDIDVTGGQPPANSSQFVSQSVPSYLDPGQTASVSITMKNTGSDTWSSGNGQKLGTQNEQDNSLWTGSARVGLSGNVSPDSQHTFTFDITAPLTSGYYNFQFKMVDDSGDNRGWFGAQTQNVRIQVGAVPIRIQAEDYNSAVGFGTQDTTDTGGGQNLKNAAAGNTATYNNININPEGYYNLSFRIASLSQNSNFVLKRGNTSLVTVNQPATGGYQNWTTWTTTTPVFISAGTDSLTIEAIGGGWNLNWFEFIPVIELPVADPVVSFELPIGDTRLFVGDSLDVRVGATDANGIDRIRLYIDNVELVRSEGLAPYEWSGSADPELANLQEGSFTLTARATDNSGDVGEASITVTVVDPANLPPIYVNFQPAGAAVPSGYIADRSEVFGDRGNGYSYGWESAFNQTRERNANSDKRLDTLNHTQVNGGDHSWEIELPNGDYEVSLTGGDPSSDNSFIEFIAEEGTANAVTLMSGDAAGVNFVSGTQMVTVSDGRLTISNGPLAVNNKICYVDIFPGGSNTPPVIIPPQPVVPEVGVPFCVSFAATDADGDDITYVAIERPDWMTLNPTTGEICGTPPDAGSFTIRVQARDPHGDYAEGAVIITVNPAPEPYQEWKDTHNVTDDTADDDNDGMENLLEFALGGDPRVADDARKPEINKSGNNVNISFHRGEASVRYVIEKSTDLINWSDHLEVNDTHGVVGGQCSVPVALSEMNNGKLFLRLKVEN